MHRFRKKKKVLTLRNVVSSAQPKSDSDAMMSSSSEKSCYIQRARGQNVQQQHKNRWMKSRGRKKCHCSN